MFGLRPVMSSIGVAALAGVLTAASPAQAWCPEGDGSVPGTGPSVTAVATPLASVYVVDHDAFDLDGDEQAGGVWIYLESNDEEGLQRGGDQVVFDVLADHGIERLPHFNPIPVCTPVKCITLFPNSSGWHGTLAQMFGMHDDCRQSHRPDTLLF